MKHYTWKKRAFAAVMSAAMLSTTLVATPIVWAADKTVTVNQKLEVAIPDPDNPDTPKNAKECTYEGLMSDLTGTGENHTTLTSLQFNFTADEEISNFSYYFGINLDADPWWTGTSKECTPYASEFSVVVYVKDLNLQGAGIGYCIDPKYHSDRHIQFQNAYAANGETKVPVTLTSIVVNGTTDTSNNPNPDPDPDPDPDPEAKYPNTGDAGFYSSQNEQSGNYEFTDNKDGTATIKATLTKKINAEDMKALAQEKYGSDAITLTPSPEGQDYSEEHYTVTDENGNETVMKEEDIRKAGYPLNSHRFSYEDFGINSSSDAAKITPEALTVVMRAPEGQNVTRVMYGGGLNVYGKSPADTESPKTAIGRDKDGNVVDSSLAGFKSDPNAGYWYNDIGADDYDEIMTNVKNAGSEFGVTVQNGKDLKEQNFGDYVEVTWDVPADVRPYVDAKTSNTISFQLWYGEIEAEEYTPLESLDIDSAMLTYTQEVTFPYQASQTLTTNATLTTGADPAEFLFSDFDQMTYVNTADVYAILFTLDTKVSARQITLGSGTTVLDKKSDDHWYQADANGNSITLVNVDDTKKEYTYMWVMPQAVATTYKYAEDGTVNKSSTISNFISTEQPNDNFKLGLYYADDASAKEITSATVKSVTLYYNTDDKNNTAKTDMFEADLTASPKEIVLEVGDTKKITVNVDGSTFTSSDDSIASVDEYGNVTGNGAGTATITVTTPKGQTATVEVTVNASTTTTVTTTATTTTTTTTITTTKKPFTPLYGDTNLDGVVDLRDAITMNRYLAKQIVLSDEAFTNADVYGPDGNVGEEDGGVLVNYVVLLITSLPVPIESN